MSHHLLHQSNCSVQLQDPNAAPQPRGGHSAVAVGNKMVCFGGADRTPMPYADIWIFQRREPSDPKPMQGTVHWPTYWQNRHHNLTAVTLHASGWLWPTDMTVNVGSHQKMNRKQILSHSKHLVFDIAGEQGAADWVWTRMHPISVTGWADKLPDFHRQHVSVSDEMTMRLSGNNAANHT